MIRSRLRAAWLEAGRRLGIRVTAPYACLDEQGKPIEADVFLPDFGSSYGAFLAPLDGAVVRRHADGALAFVARVFDAYARFDEVRFIAALNDWGWKNKSAAPPEWYTGAPWQ